MRGVSTPTVLLTGSSRTSAGSRPAFWQACAMRCRTCSSLVCKSMQGVGAFSVIGCSNRERELVQIITVTNQTVLWLHFQTNTGTSQTDILASWPVALNHQA